jgi:hypothetical protein
MKQNRTVPLEKQSKKSQKRFHTAKRGSWLGVNPVTRMPANPKAYCRAKEKLRELKRMHENDGQS